MSLLYVFLWFSFFFAKLLTLTRTVYYSCILTVALYHTDGIIMILLCYQTNLIYMMMMHSLNLFQHHQWQCQNVGMNSHHLFTTYFIRFIHFIITSWITSILFYRDCFIVRRESLIATYIFTTTTILSQKKRKIYNK